MSAAHVVQELCLQVDFDDEDQAFAAQERLAHFAQGMALRVLDEAFGEAFGRAFGHSPGPDAVLRLPELELDLGWLPADADEEAWAARLRQVLHDALAALDGSDQRRSADEARLDTLSHYLRHGSLPWYAAPATDPAALARLQWQQDPAALLAWLRTQTLDASLRQRLAWHLPAEWSGIQRALSEPIKPDAVRPSAPRLPPAQRAALRRLKALLNDERGAAESEDPTELLALWTRLQAGEPDALRRLLCSLGAQARVRRLMARQWPQALLLQAVALWLPQAEVALLEAVLRQHPRRGTARQAAWTRLLRELLVPAQAGAASQGLGHPTAAPLIAAWTADETTAPGAVVVAAPVEPSWSGMREQAARLTREAFARRLAEVLGASHAPDVAQALADLAFDELPPAWRGARPRGDAAERVQWALELIHAGESAAVTPQALVSMWWRRMAAQRLLSPDELLRALSAEPAGTAERTRRAAWQRWLPAATATTAAPSTDAATEVLTALSDGAAQPAALTLAEPAALRLHLARRWGKGRAAPAELPCTLNGLSQAAWLWLLRRFLPAADAALLEQGLQQLAAVARQASGAAALRTHALSALLWGGATRAAGCLTAVLQALARAQDDSPVLLATRAAEQASRSGAAGLAELFATAAAVESNAAPTAPRTLLRQQALGPLSAKAFSELLGTLLQNSAQHLVRAAEQLSRGLGPHAAVEAADWRAAVLAWALSAPAAADAPAALRGLLLHLAHWRGVLPTRLAAQAAAAAAEAELSALFTQAAQALARSPQAQRACDAEPPADAPADGVLPNLRTLLRGPAEHARTRLRQLSRERSTRRVLAAQLQPALVEPLLALYLPTEAREGAAVMRLLTLEMSGTSIARLLAEQLLCTLPHTPPGAPAPRLAELLDALLQQSARPLRVTVPVLARRLQAKALAYGLPAALLAPWLVRVAPVAIEPRPVGADGSVAAPLAATVAHLRASPGAADDVAARGRWQLLMKAEDSGHARTVLARELESPLAAERLSALLSAEELHRALAWLRPADAPTLAQVWPALLAVPAPRGWPAVARAVLRELFQEGRRLDGAGLLQRAAHGQSASPAPTPLVLPWQAPGGAHGAQEPFFIGNAGLVLAGPYLPRLFTLLKLTQDKAFVDQEAAQRAVLLLQFLASGQAAAPEPELVLNKLLCGLAPDTPVPPAVELTAAEREAAEGLLLAMIAHWSALGQTSIAGLRQTFLQREGRLEHEGEAWQLHVPTQTFDMLLDRLPWGYATLKFPWMPEVLHVTWR